MKNVILLVIVSLFCACSSVNPNQENSTNKLPIIFDTDANNELDDQHALAFLLLNDSIFDIKAVTVNATYNGGGIEGHYNEAQRIIKLCNKSHTELLKGANASFDSIYPFIKSNNFDGYVAVNKIISEAHKQNNQKLIVLAVGKLTNVALAVKKDSSIINKIRLVWLGSNFPEPGEYNLENDIPAMNYLLQTSVEFEMPVCRYGKASGTDAVRVTKTEIDTNMVDKGPQIENAITGRHGGKFYNFGNYSLSLFEHADHFYGDPPSRALFDMAAVAIVKNKNWAKPTTIPAPIMVNKKWVKQNNNSRKIVIWENFDAHAIKTDFFETFNTNTSN